VELIGKGKWYNSRHVYCQAKGWSKKELRKLSQRFRKGFLKWYDGGGENEITSKLIFEVEVSFSYQNVNFPFICRDFWRFSFSSSFFALSLEDLGVLMIFEEKITSSKNSFQLFSIY
jgi:hypothetical protein